jgi:hypothetical protein
MGFLRWSVELNFVNGPVRFDTTTLVVNCWLAAILSKVEAAQTWFTRLREASNDFSMTGSMLLAIIRAPSKP